MNHLNGTCDKKGSLPHIGGEGEGTRGKITRSVGRGYRKFRLSLNNDSIFALFIFRCVICERHFSANNTMPGEFFGLSFFAISEVFFIPFPTKRKYNIFITRNKISTVNLDFNYLLRESAIVLNLLLKTQHGKRK